VGLEAATNGVSVVARFLSDRLSDQSLRVSDALKGAADRAWRTLETGAGGRNGRDGRGPGRRPGRFASRCGCSCWRRSVTAGPRRSGVRAAVPGGAPRGRPACSTATPTRKKLAARLGDLTRFGEPTALLASQWALADELAADLNGSGFPTLAVFVALRPTSDPSSAPLLLWLCGTTSGGRSRTTEAVPGLAFAQLERIGKAQEDGAAQLAGLMSRYVERLAVEGHCANHAGRGARTEGRAGGRAWKRNPSPTPPKEGRGSGTGL